MKVTGSAIMTTMTTMMMIFIICFVVNVKADGRSNRKLKARERMKVDRQERESRLLSGGDAAGMVFTRGYICIIKPADYVWSFNQDGVARDLLNTNDDDEYLGTSNPYLGSSYFQSGGIYDPGDVQIVDRVGTSAADRFESFAQFDKTFRSDEFPDSEGYYKDEHIQQISGPETDSPSNSIKETFYDFFPNRFQFAGQRQPLFVPQADPGYFMNGECVISSAVDSIISGHSCLLNLCLGGGGHNCLAIYAGSKYVFDPLAVTLVDTDVKKGVKETLEVNTVKFTAAGTNPIGEKQTQAEYKANANRLVPALPPSYPGTIIGGTGAFVGAVGYVDITTITAGTLAPWQFFDGQDPTVYNSARNSEVGYITQKINVVTNRVLPSAP